MIKVMPDLSTPENREYWAYVRKVGKEVRGWPQWKQPGGTMSKVHDDKPWLADLVAETLELDEFGTHREMLAYNQGRIEVMLKLADRDAVINELKKEVEFWEHLHRKTRTLSDLKADMLEDMLKQAVDLLVGAVFRNDTEGVEEFCNIYYETWGKLPDTEDRDTIKETED